MPPLSACLKHLRCITRCQAGTQQQQNPAQHAEHEHSPAVNSPSTLDYSLALELIRESRSCWWNPRSSGLLHSGLTDTFPKGCAWSRNKQQGLKQKRRRAKGKVHLENRSSPWILPLYLGSASHHRSDSHVRVLHLPHARADRNETVKSLFPEATEKQNEQKATSPPSCSQRFQKPSQEFLLWLQQHRKGSSVAAWNMCGWIITQHLQHLQLHLTAWEEPE